MPSNNFVLKYLGPGFIKAVSGYIPKRTKNENNYIWADYIGKNIVCGILVLSMDSSR